MPDVPSGGVEFQFCDGEDDDFQGSEKVFVTGARAFVVVSHAEAGVAFDLSHDEDWTPLRVKDWLLDAGTVLAPTVAGCDMAGLV